MQSSLTLLAIMIIFLLLPFFLVSQVSIDMDSWFYGPEYTYRIRVNTTAEDSMSNDGIPSRAYDISTTLKCRPRAPDTLNCRFSSVTMGFFEAGMADLGQETLGDFEINEDPFEIKFDRKGVSGIAVSGSLSPWTVDMIRAIVSQLSVGIELDDASKFFISDGAYAKEKSFLGVCNSFFHVSQQTLENDWRQSSFQILPISGNKQLEINGKELKIDKIRDLENCQNRGNYFFGSKEGYGILHSESMIKVKSSRAGIIVSDSSFTSFTSNEISLMKKLKSITLKEDITLDLISISIANSDLPVIPNKVYTSIFVHDTLQKNSAN
ncbi:vitellogenin-like [Prorops nasuta]|uniref:vitellogenin-like n=1 Tax=Prorops nasuta TaxID=863751 RepID=UPI0034CFC79F